MNGLECNMQAICENSFQRLLSDDGYEECDDENRYMQKRNNVKVPFERTKTNTAFGKLPKMVDSLRTHQILRTLILRITITRLRSMIDDHTKRFIINSYLNRVNSILEKMQLNTNKRIET